MRIAICALSAVLLSGCSWLGGINNVFGGQGGHGAYKQQAGQYGQAGAVKYGHAAHGAQQARPQQFGQNFGGGFPQEPQFGAPQHVYNQNSGFSGTPNEGLTILSDLTGIQTSLNAPSISFDDVHSTPMRVAGGLEFIMSPKTTVFANAGFTSAEGNEGGSVSVIGDIIGSVTYQGYQQFAPTSPNTVPRALRNAPIAQFSYDFSDLERYDLEVGARHYLNPILKGNVARSITPFVGASIGAAHYNDVTLKSQVELLELHDYVLEDAVIYGPVLNSNAPQILTEAQWVPTGQLSAGLEWQATPRTAIAFETGLKFEGARNYADRKDEDGNTIAGANGDNNISVPFTIRGSYNF